MSVVSMVILYCVALVLQLFKCAKMRLCSRLFIYFASYNYCITNCLIHQVNALLSSLEIDNHVRARGPLPGRYPELEEYWNESLAMKPVPHVADGWINEFAQNRVGHADPNAWAQSFEQQHGANGWASEFEHVR